MSKKNEKLPEGAVADEKFVTLDAGVNQVVVGSIPLAKVTKRRPNYRKMNRQQKETLKASVDKFGFQDLITVVREADGTYGIVDGHHRVEELAERGSTRIPVVLLPEGTSKLDADLGMLSFNVSAEIVDHEFSSFIKELMDTGTDAEEIRKHATISEAFMKTLQSALSEPLEPSPGADEEPGPMEGEKAPKPKKAPKVKIVLLHRDMGEDGTMTQACATHADTVMGKDVAEVLEAEGIEVEEIEPLWFDNPGHLLELLASAAEDE